MTRASGAIRIVLWVRSDLPVKTFADFKNLKTPLNAGSTGVGSASTAATLFLRQLSYPIKAIMGNRGSANVMAAMERKELDARVMSQQTMQGIYRALHRERPRTPDPVHGRGAAAQAHPGLATLKDRQSQRRAATHRGGFMISTMKLLNIFALPPGTPPDRVVTLRKAFMDTLKSPELLKHAERQKLIISPASL